MYGQENATDPEDSPQSEAVSAPPPAAVPPDKTAERSSDPSQNNKNASASLVREVRLVEVLALVVNAGLAIVGIIALCIYSGQLKVMQGTLQEMKRSGSAATDQTWQAIGNINWLARTMDASVKQSQAALQASIDASRNDQRAWVGVEGFDGKAEIDKRLIITVALKNTGKTPAINLTVSENATPVDAGKEPPLIDIPVEHSQGMLFPNQLYTVPLNVTSRRTQGLDAHDYQLITSGAVVIYAYGTITYSDVFGRKHWTKFCSYLAPGGGFNVCKTHNETDK